ncbi:hypothetical protein Tco_1167202 [Tanacetum coccineum]
MHKDSRIKIQRSQQSRQIKAKDHDISILSKNVKLKIKIHDHKHAKGTSKEFPSLQGFENQDITRSEAICDEMVMKWYPNNDDDDDEDPPAGPNQGKKTKRRKTKESESSKKPSSTKETPKGKAPSKGSKIGKSASAKELVEEPIAEVVMDDMGKDVVRDDDQPQDTSEPKTAKTPNLEWFKQPPRPPTPDLE